VRFLTEDELKPKKGVPGSKVKHWRDERDGKFVKRRKFGPRLYGWPEPLIDKYLDAIAAGHTQEQATILAEDYLKTLLSQSDNAAA
jgi:predicted DNA-binding transcriptional regulator AlpA